MRCEHGAIFVGYPYSAVNHEQHHVGIGNRFLGSANAFSFDLILRPSKSRGIQQAQRDAVDVD